MSGFREAIRRLERKFDAKRYLSEVEHKEEGENWQIECPACEGNKLYVYVGKPMDGKNPGAFICFRASCGEQGSAFDLVRLLGDLNLFAAVDVLKEFSEEPDRAGDIAAIVKRAFAGAEDVESDREDAPVPLPDEFIAVQMDRRFPIPTYFRERGIDRIDAVRRGIGWCEAGRYSNRIVVPVHRRGKVAWFQARWMAKNPPQSVKKYLNAGAARSSLDLYDLDRWRRCRRLALVEDVFSAIWVGRGAVGTFGTHFSRAQMALLAESDAQEIVVCWDPDAIDKAHELARSLSEIWRVGVLELPKGHDPDDLPRDRIRSMIDRCPMMDDHSIFRQLVAARL